MKIHNAGNRNCTWFNHLRPNTFKLIKIDCEVNKKMSSTSSNEVTGSSKSLSADSATTTATHIENPMEEGPLRYLAYGSRLKTAIVAGARYLAYTSDVGSYHH